MRAATRWTALVLGLSAAVAAVALFRTPHPEPCLAREVASRLGRDHLLLGGRMSELSLASAPFDLRYQYLAGGVPDEACRSCRTCTVNGFSCANPNTCGWWGCWQSDQLPPGRFITDFVRRTEAQGAIPMFTWFNWFYVAGRVEGPEEVAALRDPDRVRRYIDDYRRLCRTVASQATGPVILHLEPDLWAFTRKVDADPTAIPVALYTADVPECAGLRTDVAGFARCLIRIARAEIPGVLVGLHASHWDDLADAFENDDPTFDLQAHAARTASYLRALGVEEADLIVVEMNHRDAGFNGTWWDATDQTLPNFQQAIDWAVAVSRGTGRPHLWWQVPYGHLGLEDTCGRYQDNRLDYVFDHPERFATGATVGIAFGAGTDCRTTPETDDGHFLSRSAAWFAAPPPPMCPDG